MRLFSTRLRAGVIERMHQLVSQLATMRIEDVDIPEVFFRRIQSTVICPAPEFVKAGSMAKLSFDEYRMSCCLIATPFQQLGV